MSQLDEDGLLPDIVGGTARALKKGVTATAKGAAKAYGTTNMAARGRAKKAVKQWVSRITRDWQEYAQTQLLKNPRESDVYEFLQAEYGRYDPKLNDALERKIAELRNTQPGNGAENGGDQDDVRKDQDWNAFSHAASPDRDRPDEIRQRGSRPQQSQSQPASGKAWSKPGVGPGRKNWSSPDVKANPASRASQQTMQAQYARSQAAKAPQQAQQPQARQEAPVHDREQHGPGKLRVGEQPPARANLANWDKDNIRHRHRSDTIDFDAFDHEDELHKQIDAARRDRNKKLKKEAVATQARAVLETAATVAAYARTKGTGAIALEAVASMETSFDGEANAFLLARKMIAENLSPEAVVVEAMRLVEADQIMNRHDIGVIFSTFARTLLRNPDIRYATIRLDPKNPRFDGFYRNIARGGQGSPGNASHGPASPASPSPGSARQGTQKTQQGPSTDDPGHIPSSISTSELTQNLQRLGVHPHAFENLRHLIDKEGMQGALHRMGHHLDDDARKMLVALMAIVARHG